MTQARSEAKPAWLWLDARVDVLLCRRVRPVERDLALADTLRVVAAATRSGASLQQALHRASQRADGPVAHACARAASRIAFGRSVEESVESLAEAVGGPAAMLFAQVVRVQHRRGGDLGGPCHRLATLLHERARLDAEARAATAQARFSARAVLAVPLLLAVAATWRAPDAVRAMLQPDTLLLAAPGIMLITAGALAARRIAQRACDVGAAGVVVDGDGAVRRLIRAVAGPGARSRQAARLAAIALACCIPALGAGPSPALVAASLIAVAAAAAWPWSEQRRLRRMHAATAQAGIESLLEVSIALLAAGATAHEVATIAPASADEPLRAALAPAVHRVGLGRTVASAFDEIPEVAASPQLDGWLHAICTCAELGAPAIAVLEQLLRDARSARREQLRSIAQTAAPRMQLALVLLVVPGVMWLMLLATIGGLVRQLQASGVM
jgi:Flp pilus assembly protein TadB